MVALMIKVCGSSWAPLRIRSTSSLAAATPISYAGWAITERGGSTARAHTASSKLISPTSRPIRSRRRLSPVITPRASIESTVNKESGGSAASSSSSITSRPLSVWKGTCRTDRRAPVPAHHVLVPEPALLGGRGVGGPGDAGGSLPALPEQVLGGHHRSLEGGGGDEVHRRSSCRSTATSGILLPTAPETSESLARGAMITPATRSCSATSR